MWGLLFFTLQCIIFFGLGLIGSLSFDINWAPTHNATLDAYKCTDSPHLAVLFSYSTILVISEKSKLKIPGHIVKVHYHFRSTMGRIFGLRL